MRLIDADALLKKFDEVRKTVYFHPTIYNYAMNVIRRFPTIEAEPVRHGRWVDRYGNKYANQLYECSECKEKALYKYEVDVLGNGHFVQALSNACPHCRAKMEGGGAVTRREKLIEARNAIIEGRERVADRTIWQNELIWWLCKAVLILIEKELKK